MNRADSGHSDSASTATDTIHVCRLLACSSPLAYRSAGAGPLPRPKAPLRVRVRDASSAETVAADARASKALSAARAMAVEAQQTAAGGSGRSSLDGVAYDASVASMVSDGDHFDADGRCHSPGSVCVRGGGAPAMARSARTSAEMETDSCSGDGSGDATTLEHPDQPAGPMRASGGSLRSGGRAGSLRSMCSDLHDMGKLLGAPSDARGGDSDEVRAACVRATTCFGHTN